MKAANIKAVYRVDELYLINGEQVKELNFVDYIDDELGEVIETEFDELECYDYPYDFAVAMKDEQSFAALVY
jgi:hypothetical protein